MSGVSPGVIQQAVDTIPGTYYRVTFDLSGNAGAQNVKTLQVSAADDSQIYTHDSTGDSMPGIPWSTRTFDFEALSIATTLEFASLTSGSEGPALDNVEMIVLRARRVPILSPVKLG